MTRLYLAGPMRGFPEFNFPAFRVAAWQLRGLGFVDVFSPAERDVEVGFDPRGLTGFEDLAALGFSLREALAADLSWIALHADGIALLPGWEDSSGALAEVALGRALGLPTLPLHEWLTFRPGGRHGTIRETDSRKDTFG